MKRSRVVNSVGAVVTAVVLVIVLITKFANGAWIVVVAMPIIWLTLRAMHRHYANVAPELDAGPTVLHPAVRNHAIVLVPSCTCRRCARWPTPAPPGPAPGGLTVDVDDAEMRALKGNGTARDPRPADRDRLAVPGDHPADRRLRQAAAAGEPARHRDRLHPGVRARPLVGADAAQPERAFGSRAGCSTSGESSSPACRISWCRRRRRLLLRLAGTHGRPAVRRRPQVHARCRPDATATEGELGRALKPVGEDGKNRT